MLSSRPLVASASNSSLWPEPYTSAVSKKLTPDSIATSIARNASLSSRCPQSPPIAHVPNAHSLIFIPVFPSCLYFIYSAPHLIRCFYYTVLSRKVEGFTTIRKKEPGAKHQVQ